MKEMLQQLQQGCETLGLDVSDEKLAKLIAYVQLLAKWNKAFNLTSVREPQEMISRHILDSLAIQPYLSGDSLLDVGTGAGLPGIPLAIVRPEMTITLLDSNSKKTRFLQQAKAELALESVTVIHSRVEQADLPKFDLVTARAFSTIDDIIDLAGRHCDDAGCLVLMKGVYPEEELQAVTNGFSLQDVVSLDVPGCEGQRHLVRLIKS
ncbi:16S rRNA (guanine(527)-N(7))-methyltransferase RsmG [Methylophaga sp. 42_25_T18]|nr:16S rRNA (guanine(527)-N(7))-methyltransferase RsmG [Methylophaga sp. 42_25_T18]OUR88809.1 16S rRNA (guanine(527)-N(7))-methyltransferase RsmG [Methylophaga sp. 42_8_T64]